MKTGMLFNEETVQTVIKCLQEYYGDRLPALVVDPVCVSTSGHTLLDPQAISILREKLLPLATIVTPNIPEAEELLSAAKGSISSVQDMLTAVVKLSALGSKAILLKGGHTSTSTEELQSLWAPGISVQWMDGCIDAPDSVLILQQARRQGLPSPIPGQGISNDRTLVVDILYQSALPNSFTLFARPRIATDNTHGTGCTLAAVLVAELASGKTGSPFLFATDNF